MICLRRFQNTNHKTQMNFTIVMTTLECKLEHSSKPATVYKPTLSVTHITICTTINKKQQAKT